MARPIPDAIRSADLPPISLRVLNPHSPTPPPAQTPPALSSLEARLVHTLARRRLEIGFGVFLLIASGRFILGLAASPII
jgi:hypothetical protein